MRRVEGVMSSSSARVEWERMGGSIFFYQQVVHGLIQ